MRAYKVESCNPSNGELIETTSAVENIVSKGTRSPALTRRNASLSTITNAEIYGLYGSRAYRIYVLSINKKGITDTGGNSTKSNVFVTLDPQVPSTIVNAPIVSLNLQKAIPDGVLTWNKAPRTGGSDVIGYMIQRRITPRYDVNNAESYMFLHYINNTNSLVTTYTLNDLQTGNVYGFRVAAINSIGRSSFTSSSLTSKVVATVPTQILSAPIIINPFPTYLTLTWIEPLKEDGSSGDGGADIVGYRIILRQGDNSLFNVLVENTNSTSLNATIINLQANGIYEFKVSAINSAGVAQPSLSSGKQNSYVVSDVRMLGSETVTSFDTSKELKFREAISKTINMPLSNIDVVSIDNILDGNRRRRMMDESTYQQYQHQLYQHQQYQHNNIIVVDEFGRRRRLGIIGIDIVLNITDITASDASTANTALQTSVNDGTLLTNIQNEGISVTSTTQQQNSTIVQILPSPATAPPVPPASSNIPPTFTDIKSGEITLSWQAPTDNGGSMVTGYKIAAFLDAKEGNLF